MDGRWVPSRHAACALVQSYSRQRDCRTAVRNVRRFGRFTRRDQAVAQALRRSNNGSVVCDIADQFVIAYHRDVLPLFSPWVEAFDRIEYAHSSHEA